MTERGPRISAYVWWSFYVRAGNRDKLRTRHMPPINEGLESLDFPWEISTDETTPGLFRLVTYQNVAADRVEDIVITVLRRAYRLAPSWTIIGLGDLGAGRLSHFGGGARPETKSKLPDLVSLAFEVQPGQVTGQTSAGGWNILDQLKAE